MSYNSDVKGDKNGVDIVVEIPQGSGANRIGTILEEKGVIKNATFWKIYLKSHSAGEMQYGEYTLNSGMSYDELIAELNKVRTKRETISVTFPEGFTLIQFAQRMENNGLCTAEEFIDTANNGDFSQFEFWNHISDNPDRFMKAEGYLYPDTYNFYVDDTVYNMICTIFANFESKITDDMYDRMDEIGMSLDEVITLASFVQEEAGNSQNDNVAQVFLNRLAPDSPYPRLESNASSYVQNDADNNYIWNWVKEYYGGWNKIPHNIMDAYDTYKCTGLPAGPISNPGIEVIESVLDPHPDNEAKDAYFFVTDVTGKYYYAKTYEQHQANCNVAFSVKG